jgi:hypothetical protein
MLSSAHRLALEADEEHEPGAMLRHQATFGGADGNRCQRADKDKRGEAEADSGGECPSHAA